MSVKPLSNLATEPEAAAVTVFDVKVPTKSSEGFEAVYQEVIHLDAAPFRARRVAIRLANCLVVVHRVKARLRSRTTVAAGLVGFQVVAPKARGRLNGIAMRPDELVVGAPGSVSEVVVERGYRSVMIMLPPARLLEQLRRRRRVRNFAVPSGMARMRVNVPGNRSLYELCHRLSVVAERRPQLFDERPDLRESAEVEVIEALLEALSTAEAPEPSRSDATRGRYSRIVRLAEKRALADPNQRLYVADLCEAARVSERTLQTAFHAALGISPMSFVKRVRLHQARRALETATRGSTTVTNVALDWGFWHFGEFSTAYRECFGESPSSTLRRKWQH